MVVHFFYMSMPLNDSYANVDSVMQDFANLEQIYVRFTHINGIVLVY